MATERSDDVLVETSRDRFGEPLTNDEVYGYWLFLLSILVAAVGTVVALTTLGGEANATREVGFALAALGLAGAPTGLVVGQSFSEAARYLVYIGAIAPVVVGQSRARAAAERALAEARAETEAARDEAAHEEAEATREETEAAREETEVARETANAERARADEAEARLEQLHDSNATFQLYEDRSDQWRWRLVPRNTNIIATSGEGYASDRSARRGMRSVTRNALGADVFWDRKEVEPDPEPEPVAEESRATVELYSDEAGEDRWRLLSSNDEIVADGGEGYSSRSKATNAVDRVKNHAPAADTLTVGEAAIEVFEDESSDAG